MGWSSGTTVAQHLTKLLPLVGKHNREKAAKIILEALRGHDWDCEGEVPELLDAAGELLTINCPDCDAKIRVEHEDTWYDDENSICNGEYGCDTGCEFVRANIKCECGYTKQDGTFGYYENKKEAKEYLEEILGN